MTGVPPSKPEWNPRYVAYARENGRTPENMLEHDRTAWPGGCMTGFMLWTNSKWAQWLKPQGRHYRSTTQQPRDILTAADHATFDEWLDNTVQTPGRT